MNALGPWLDGIGMLMLVVAMPTAAFAQTAPETRRNAVIAFTGLGLTLALGVTLLVLLALGAKG